MRAEERASHQGPTHNAMHDSTITYFTPQIILLSGPRQAGKSTLCRKLVAALQRDHLTVAGLLTTHTGPHDLEVSEIHSGARYALTLPFGDGVGAELGRFRMDAAAAARGIASLTRALPAAALVIDELGPLEFKLGRGWLPALSLLQAECCRAAVLVVRPELLGEAFAHLPTAIATVVYVTLENRDALLEALLRLISAELRGAAPLLEGAKLA